MAVIQITRVQHRRGTSGELPDALADGEFGVTTDTGEIFMGAPNLPALQNRRSYPYQNIKVLTEFDIQRGIKGDVYHHGPLVGVKLPSGSASAFVPCVPLFRHGSVDYAVFDFGLSTNNSTIKAVGEIAICIHPGDPNASTVKVTIKNSLNFSPEALAAIGCKVQSLSPAGNDNGITWLAVRTGTAFDWTFTVTGREWTNPPL